LFYALFRGGIAFASEQKSLFAGGRVAPEVSLRGVIDVAHFWAPQAPNSSFKNIVALPPGHYATFHLGHTSTRCYWDWDFASRDAALPAHSFASHVDQLRALFEDAVRLQLRSDVPVGSYLSGGLDSAAVTAAIKRQEQTALTTFSITFEDTEFDESAQQRLLAQELGTRHVSRPVTAQEIGASLPRAIEHIEAPLVRTAGIPLMLLADLVRSSGFKVVLTGEGADEVFAGYDIFKEAQIRRFWARAPQSSWRPALLNLLYGYVANSPTRQIAFARSFFGKGLDQIDSPWFAHQTRIESTSRVLRLLSSDARAAVVKDRLIEELFSRLPIPNPAWRALERDQYVEAHTLLTNYLLAAQGDRVAMAASIEGRYPYLDHRLIEFASRLPPRWKLRGLREKHILREAVAPWLTNDAAQRPKQPYRAPDSRCFFANGKPLDYVAELLSPRAIDRAGLFDSKAVENLTLKCARGLASGFSDNMAFMIVLSTQQLHQTFIAKSA
jgi:asparagine synthase (glutamine-hydrolysing)